MDATRFRDGSGDAGRDEDRDSGNPGSDGHADCDPSPSEPIERVDPECRAEEALRRLAEAECACDGTKVPAGHCEALRRPLLRADLGADLAAGRTTVAPRAFVVCLQSLRACGYPLGNRLNFACEDAFVGTLAIGDECTADRQCADGNCEPVRDYEKPRECAHDDGVYFGVCNDMPGLGEPCRRRCEPGLRCVLEGDDPDAPFVCREPLAAQATCAADNFDLTLRSVCEWGLSCLPESECRPLGQTGEPCSAVATGTNGVDTCAPGYLCGNACVVDEYLGPTTGHVTEDAPGDSCERSCGKLLYCEEGTCRAPRPNGEACGRSIHCASRFCAQGRCESPYDACVTAQ